MTEHRSGRGAGTGAPAELALRGSPRRRAAAGSGPACGVAARLMLAAWLTGGLGCGGAQPAPSEPAAAAAPAADNRTPIERRRDTACDQLAPKVTACAVEDARADLAAGKIDRRQLEIDTAPDVQRKHTDEFARACRAGRYTSRQVRVLEVCFHEERACAALLDCLGHLQDPEPAGPRHP